MILVVSPNVKGFTYSV